MFSNFWSFSLKTSDSSVKDIHVRSNGIFISLTLLLTFPVSTDVTEENLPKIQFNGSYFLSGPTTTYDFQFTELIL